MIILIEAIVVHLTFLKSDTSVVITLVASCVIWILLGLFFGRVLQRLRRVEFATYRQLEAELLLYQAHWKARSPNNYPIFVKVRGVW